MTFVTGLSEWLLLLYKIRSDSKRDDFVSMGIMMDGTQILFLSNPLIEFAILLCFLNFRMRMEKIVVKNIYLSMIFLILLWVVINVAYWKF